MQIGMRPKKKKKNEKKATEKSKNFGSKSNYELCTYLNAADKISLVKSLNQWGGIAKKV